MELIKKSKTNRRSSLVLLMVLALWLVLLTVVPVVQANITGSLNTKLGDIGVASSGNVITWTLSDTNISANASSTSTSDCGNTTYTQKEDTLTLTNNKTTDAVLSFNYSSSNVGSFTIDGEAPSGGTVSKTLGPGESIKVYFQTAQSDKEGSVSLTNITLAAVGELSITFEPCDGVVYKVNENEVSSTTGPVTLSGITGTKYVITCTTTNYHCAYATIGNDMVLLDSSNSVMPTETCTIVPVFVEDTNNIAPFKVGEISYWTWDAAFAAAGSSGTVILTDNYTIPAGTYEIPSGVSFLVPYSDSDYVIDASTDTDDSGNLQSTWIYANNAWTSDNYDNGSTSDSSVSGILEPNTSVFRTLTIPSGTTVNVASGGKFVIGGTIVSGSNNTGGVCGATAGAHSNLVVEAGGALNVNSGGVLSVCGYVLGEGNVNVVGGSIYQPFTMMDYHDGHHTANSTKNANFPAYRYIMQNIQTPMTISSSGRMYGYVDIYTQASFGVIQARHNVACQMIIGTESDAQCLIKLSSGASASMTYDSSDYVTTTSNQAGSAYYAKAGKTKLTLDGGATLGYLAISVEVPVVGTQTSQSSATDFPVPYHYDINLKNGTFTIPYNLVLYPGATMYVAEDANLVVSANKFVVLDGLRDYTSRSTSVSYGSWYEYHYPSTADFRNNHSKGTYTGTSNLIVDGTLTVNSGASFGGYIQTNGTGQVNMNGTPSATAGVGNVVCYGSVVNKFAGRTERTLSAWLYQADGDLIPLNTGDVYYGVDGGTHTIETYAYKLYTTADSTSTYIGVGVNGSSGEVDQVAETLNAPIMGSWCTVEGHRITDSVTDPTCTEKGYTTHICSACGYSYKDTEVQATGHTEETDTAVAPTCTATGLTEGKHCSVCDEILIAQTTVAATGHTAGAVATCTTAQTCTVCGAELAAATGHTEVTDAAVEATCTTAGKTEGKHCSVCDAVIVAQTEVAALGHTEETDAAVEATCTTAGKTEGKHCSVCGEILVAQEVVAALGHTEVTDAAVDATCTETGLTAGSHCETCGEVIVAQEEIPALGHSYSTSVNTETLKVTYTCSGCGDEYTTDGIILQALDCSYDSEILLRMKFVISDAMLSSDATITMTKYGRETETVTYTMAQLKANGMDASGRYVTQIGVASGEMTSKVVTEVKDGDGNVITMVNKDYKVRGTSIDYSVKKYVEAVLASTLPDENKAAAKALIVYGGYAQQYFDVDKENPAYNLDGVDSSLGEVSLSADYEATADGSLTGIDIKSYELHLDSYIFMRVRFEVTGGTDISGYTVNLKGSGTGANGVALQLKQDSDGIYYVDTIGIPAAWLDSVYTVTVTNGTETMTLNLSALSWIKYTVDKNENTERVNMAKALYFYNQACNTLFGK